MPQENLINKFSKDAPLWLIGCGKMGSAILKAWLEQGLNPKAVIVVDPCAHETAPKEIPPSFCYDNVKGLDTDKPPSLVVLAVKPQVMDSVLADLKPKLNDKSLLITIAAGITMGGVAKRCGTENAIIRAMPNTPAAIKKGITALIKNQNATNDDAALAEKLFSACGKTVWLDDESQFDAVTALSGSGPAYVFYLVEAMAEAGVMLGLDEGVATDLARQTLIGAAGLLQESNESANKLRENVTSPNGTTEAALSILMADSGLKKLMSEAMKKARDRGIELSGES